MLKRPHQKKEGDLLEELCNGQNICPSPPKKDVRVLIPGTYEYVTSHDKRDSADVIKLRTLRGAHYPGRCGQRLYRREVGGSESKVGDVRTEQRLK